MVRRSRLCASAAAVAAALAQSPSLFQPERISAHVKVLASDEFQGRAPSTEGEQKTIDYITKQLASFGVQPGGDPDADGQRRWTQGVPLARSELTGPLTATLKIGGESRSLQQAEDIAIRATMLPVSNIAVSNAPLVFVGYGIKAPERHWDDYKGIDLHGKIAIVLVNDPDFEADLGSRFDGKSMTYYGRWTYKYEEAARQGALGMLIVHETAPASYGWATVKNSNTQPIFDIRREHPADTHLLLEAWIQRPVAIDLFRAAGLDFDAEKKKAQSESFRPVRLRDATLSATYNVRHAEIVSHNIVGVLPGTKYPQETVIYCAHWDHLGVGLPDAKGDRIYNGARDNALGVAGQLEIARIFATQPRTERSVVFLFVTAEEKGLLGSEYYGQHPLYPLALTAAVYNDDGGSTVGPAHDVSIRGDAKLTLQADVANAAKAQARYFSPDPAPERGSFYRSDHFSFAKVGVPAISFSGGEDLLDGGKAEGAAARERYNSERYHQPADEYSETWNLRGEALDLELLYNLGRNMANSRIWPEWLPGSEFKPIRDATSTRRKP